MLPRAWGLLRAITLWIDAETYHSQGSRGHSERNARGSVSRGTTTIKYQPNPKLEPAQFRFAVPETWLCPPIATAGAATGAGHGRPSRGTGTCGTHLDGHRGYDRANALDAHRRPEVGTPGGSRPTPGCTTYGFSKRCTRTATRCGRSSGTSRPGPPGRREACGSSMTRRRPRPTPDTRCMPSHAPRTAGCGTGNPTASRSYTWTGRQDRPSSARRASEGAADAGALARHADTVDARHCRVSSAAERPAGRAPRAPSPGG